MIKVSVIVPVYNAEKYLKVCLESLVNQTLEDIEIIIINDGSIDHSQNIIDKYKKEYPSKIISIKKKNEGVGIARNKGLDIARGEYIRFVDSDDYIDKNNLEIMYRNAKKYNVQLVVGNYKTILGPITTLDKCNFYELKENAIININENKDYIVKGTSGIGNKLISSILFKDIRFPENTKWEDLAIMPLIVALSNKIYYMNEPVYNYRTNLNTTVNDFLKTIPNISDIVKCLDILNNHFIEKNLYEEYTEQLKDLYVLHIFFRIQNVLTWIDCPKKEKIKVINILIKTLDEKYTNWRDTCILEEYSKINKIFNINMKKLDKYTNDKITKKFHKLTTKTSNIVL